MEIGIGSKLRELQDEDVRGLSDAVLKEADKASVEFARQKAAAGNATLATTRILKEVSEKQMKMSWIWTAVDIREDGSDPGFNDGKDLLFVPFAMETD